MALWTSDQVNQILSTQGNAIAGLGGAPTLPRATEVRGIIKEIRFTIELDNPNPMPGTPPGAAVLGDEFIIALVNPTDRIYMGEIFGLNPNSNAVFDLSAGKVDPNNAANTDTAHYLSTTMAVIVAHTGLGSIVPVQFAANMTEQFGDDPKGDQSTGNKIPEFGSQKIQVVIRISSGNGGSVGTGASLFGFIFIVEEGN